MTLADDFREAFECRGERHMNEAIACMACDGTGEIRQGLVDGRCAICRGIGKIMVDAERDAYEQMFANLAAHGIVRLSEAHDEIGALREKLAKAEAERGELSDQMAAIDKAIGDSGLPEYDCSLPMPERMANILRELSDWRTGSIRRSF